MEVTLNVTSFLLKTYYTTKNHTLYEILNHLFIPMKKSTWLPLLLLIYLGIMCYIGRGEFYAGNSLYYFGIIAATLFCILLLHIFLKRGGTIGRHLR